MSLVGEEHEVLSSVYFASHVRTQWETRKLHASKCYKGDQSVMLSGAARNTRQKFQDRLLK